MRFYIWITKSIDDIYFFMDYTFHESETKIKNFFFKID